MASLPLVPRRIMAGRLYPWCWCGMLKHLHGWLHKLPTPRLNSHPDMRKGCMSIGA
jgi:hypothetical protein